MLKLYNSLTNKKEEFIPINNKQITLYVCGPTVYDYIHIGNARALVVFDVLFRLLEHLYGNVLYSRNITDIDDKIINRSTEESTTPEKIAEKYTQIFLEDVKKLGLKDPSFQPKATENIKEMQDIIQTLVDKGFAYSKNGDVFFNTAKYANYGILSNKKIEALIKGIRIAVNKDKINTTDFNLWKKDEKFGWDSPWGKGRPGWHIECSAMIHKTLGETIDIHGGGQDLIFPHHENEIAQSTLCFGTQKLANYWVHNAYVLNSGTKMSKSLKNHITIRNLLQEYSPDEIKLTLLQTVYRQPLNFKKELLLQSRNILNKFKNVLIETKNIKSNSNKPSNEFVSVLQNDLNTPLAIQILQKDLENLKKQQTIDAKTTLMSNLSLLGLLAKIETKELNHDDIKQIEQMIKMRDEAKKNKNYLKADSIRKELLEKNIILIDTENGTKWQSKN